jgi:Mn-dependent DtxR family transcriptional regulator
VSERPLTPTGALPAEDDLIVTFLDRNGATFLMRLAQELPGDVERIRERCHDLAEQGFLERRSRTYYALGEGGRRYLRRTEARPGDGGGVA